MTLYIVITIDLETPQTPLRQGQCRASLLDPVADGEKIGYSQILRILSSYKLPGVFFADVYESSYLGEEPLRNACKNICDACHEIGLHTHPEWHYDPSKINMWQYSLEEQIQIIADGLRLLKSWLPCYKPICHRAGAYGLNFDTIKALNASGISVDSSAFYGHPNCKLSSGSNKAKLQHNILEVPVTIFKRINYRKLLNSMVYSHQELIKTDIDWASLDELKFFVKEAKAHNIRIMNLFMHSYSFVQFSSDFSYFKPDRQDIEKFKYFLAFAKADPEIKFVTMRDLYEIYQRDPNILLSGSDFVPVYCRKVDLSDKIKRTLRTWLD